LFAAELGVDRARLARDAAEDQNPDQHARRNDQLQRSPPVGSGGRAGTASLASDDHRARRARSSFLHDAPWRWIAIRV
jgi:hypothetical protein